MIARIKFSKGEEVKYVGHLDLMRTFIRCLKRTCIPLEFSKGYNPRVQISFALPLGVGITSSSEFFDLEIKEKMNSDILLGEMNSVFPQGFEALEVEYLEKENQKSLMSLVKEAIYEITIISKYDKSDFEKLFENNEIFIEKETKGKKDIQKINLSEFFIEKPVIVDKSSESKIIVEENEKLNEVIINIHSTAGSVKNMNPNYVLQAVKSYIGNYEDYKIHRKKLILNNN